MLTRASRPAIDVSHIPGAALDLDDTPSVWRYATAASAIHRDVPLTASHMWLGDVQGYPIDGDER